MFWDLVFRGSNVMKNKKFKTEKLVFSTKYFFKSKLIVILNVLWMFLNKILSLDEIMMIIFIETNTTNYTSTSTSSANYQPRRLRSVLTPGKAVVDNYANLTMFFILRPVSTIQRQLFVISLTWILHDMTVFYTTIMTYESDELNKPRRNGALHNYDLCFSLRYNWNRSRV